MISGMLYILVMIIMRLFPNGVATYDHSEEIAPEYSTLEGSAFQSVLRNGGTERNLEKMDEFLFLPSSLIASKDNPSFGVLSANTDDSSLSSVASTLMKVVLKRTEHHFTDVAEDAGTDNLLSYTTKEKESHSDSIAGENMNKYAASKNDYDLFLTMPSTAYHNKESASLNITPEFPTSSSLLFAKVYSSTAAQTTNSPQASSSDDNSTEDIISTVSSEILSSSNKEEKSPSTQSIGGVATYSSTLTIARTERYSASVTNSKLIATSSNLSRDKVATSPSTIEGPLDVTLTLVSFNRPPRLVLHLLRLFVDAAKDVAYIWAKIALKGQTSDVTRFSDNVFDGFVSLVQTGKAALAKFDEADWKGMWRKFADRNAMLCKAFVKGLRRMSSVGVGPLVKDGSQHILAALFKSVLLTIYAIRGFQSAAA